MKQTMTTYDIANALNEDKNNSFSWAGCLALAECLTDMEASSGTEMEFDRVAIRCEFSQHKSLQDWAKDYFSGDFRYSLDWNSAEEQSEKERADLLRANGDVANAEAICQSLNDDLDSVVRDYITEHGLLIEFDGGIIVSAF